jgi:methylglutaconyl-CoA hydratase
MSYRTLAVRQEGHVELVTLNRPDVRNAFDPAVIAELDDWARGVRHRPSVRAAVLSGAGKAFSAGADLAWMAQSASFTRQQNLDDARRMAAMFGALNTLPVPLIGQVHGAALGGGVGLVAVCDIAVADEQTVFALPEVRLGILPAVISPYVVAKIGESAARELFLTGGRFTAARAKEIGLVHAVTSAGQLQAAVAGYVRDVLAAGPEAVRATKELIAFVAPRPVHENPTELTTEMIAERRVSEEGQEGIRAFLEKRPPSWIDEG